MAYDEEHLRLLAIFHYILGGLTALVACFPFIHLIVGIAIVTGSFPQHPREPKGEQIPQVLGWMFIGFATAFILIGWAYAIGLALAGRNLQRRRGYVFCIVVAALSCLNMPFGTCLGVFTLVVLQRPSVKALFGRGKNLAFVSEFD